MNLVRNDFNQNWAHTDAFCNGFTMKEESNLEEQKVSIIDLYPELTQEQQEQAAYYLGRYLEVVRGIFERISNLE
jgi:hypothetical protein